jgi:hypothetical protein
MPVVIAQAANTNEPEGDCPKPADRTQANATAAMAIPKPTQPVASNSGGV